MIFRPDHIRLILEGKKTATRRRHTYPRRAGRVYRIQRSMLDWTDIRIVVTKAYMQKLGQMTEEDAKKEGASTLKAFKEIWREINGGWNPEEEVWVYEFQLYRSPFDQNK